jgi:hypothetical protein
MRRTSSWRGRTGPVWDWLISERHARRQYRTVPASGRLSFDRSSAPLGRECGLRLDLAPPIFGEVSFRVWVSKVSHGMQGDVIHENRAAVLSKAAGKPLAFVQVTPEQLREELRGAHHP